jgi:hypothetical protein
MGWNVTILLGKMGVKCVRLKCNYGTKCHSMGKWDTMKQVGNMSQSGRFVTITIKVKRAVVMSQLRYVHPRGWVDVKSLDILSGDDMSQWTYSRKPSDVALGGRSVGVKTLLGCSKRGSLVQAPQPVTQDRWWQKSPPTRNGEICEYLVSLTLVSLGIKG